MQRHPWQCLPILQPAPPAGHTRYLPVLLHLVLQQAPPQRQRLS
jgi:hypothetical protein